MSNNNNNNVINLVDSSSEDDNGPAVITQTQEDPQPDGAPEAEEPFFCVVGIKRCKIK